MAVNKYKPHVLVIPEDDANRQLADAFALEVENFRNIQVLPEVGGWGHVCDKFHSEYAKSMRVYPNRYVILLLDIDDCESRRNEIMSKIPQDIKSRVLLLGVKNEPERLKSDLLCPLAQIGASLARECKDRRREIWMHDLLKDNLDGIDILGDGIRAILFE